MSFPYLDSRLSQISQNPFFLQEVETLSNIPDGEEYYIHVIKNIDLDSQNPKNSYIMWACGKVEVLDQSKPPLFTSQAFSLPDIDIDFPPSHREETIEYVKEKYGHDCVSQIVTFSRLQGRSAITEVMRADGSFSYELIKNVTKDIPDEAAISDELAEMEDPSIIMWVLANDPDAVKDYCYFDGELKGEYAEVFRKALKLEGTLKSQGRHAAGIIISSEPVRNNAAMIKINGADVCCFEKKAAEKAGLVKFDFLNVEILEKIQEVLGNDLSNIPLDDEKVWAKLEEGNTKGCFQLETFLGSSWCKKLKPKSIGEVSDVVSLIRPGTLKAKEDGKTMINHFLDRRNKEEASPKIHPLVDEILKNTYGIIIYQEQAMSICRAIAKFTMFQANKLRKSIGSKNAALMKEVKEEFHTGCKNNNIDDDIAIRVFNMIESANRYGFNKCLSPNTLVRTKDGIKRLDDLRSGDYVDSPYGFVRVVEIYDSGAKELFGAFLSDGRHIECSLDHKFLCTDGTKRPLSDMLKNGYDFITEDGNPTLVAAISRGIQRTLDIEVDHPSHVFYGNGIATSNSHGIGYSYLTYYSAYCKVHYPLEFYKTWLSHAKNKMKPHVEVYYLVNSAKLDNVKIIPPSVKHKEKDFFIKDGNVHFGLTSIKGVSSRELDKLFSLPLDDWNTLCYDLLSVNKRTVESLIATGGFDYLKRPRIEMLHYMSHLKDLTDKNVEWIKENCKGMSIIDSLKKLAPTKKEGGGSFNQKSKEKIERIITGLLNPGRPLKDNPSFIANKEEQLIGVALSQTYLDECADRYAADTTCKEIVDGKTGNITVSAEIIAVKEYKIKKEGKNKGKKMAFLSIKDDTCEVESVVIFPEAYEMYEDLLMEKNTVIIFGEVKKDSLEVKKVYQI